MTAMLNSLPVAPGTHSEMGDLRSGMPPSQLAMIVLQPGGVLDRSSSPAFQRVLEDSLTQAAETVIVDLLWVEATDTHGILALVAGMQRAAELGKSLTLQSMDSQTRLALEAEWNRQREISFGPWNELFEQNLEQFLNGGQRRREKLTHRG